MKTSIAKRSTFLLFFSLLFTACTSFGIETQYVVQTVGSGKVRFSNIAAEDVKQGIKVTGNVKKRARAGKNIRIPGHIHIIRKTKTGDVLESVKARTHRKYGNSTLWHFDGMLRKIPVGEDLILVKYHQH